jgi:hypothetical protein
MPLLHSSTDSAFKTNVKTLMGEVGKSPHVKSRDQALAIAYATKRRARGYAFGGAPAPWQVRQEARSMIHSGPILSAVPGRTDRHNMALASGSYVIPSQAVSHLGQNNTLAGMKVLGGMFGPGGPFGSSAMKIGHGPGAPRPPRMASTASPLGKGLSDRGGARGEDHGDPVEVITAGGEHVLTPENCAAVGQASIKELVRHGKISRDKAAHMLRDGGVSHGHEVLDGWVNGLKEDHIRTLKRLPGPASD